MAIVRDNDVWVRKLATGQEWQLTFTPEFDKGGIVWRPGSQGAN